VGSPSSAPGGSSRFRGCRPVRLRVSPPNRGNFRFSGRLPRSPGYRPAVLFDQVGWPRRRRGGWRCSKNCPLVPGLQEYRKSICRAISRWRSGVFLGGSLAFAGAGGKHLGRF
jgi:hypothetical protein